MESILLRFPHIGEMISEELGSKDLIKCRYISRLWTSFLDTDFFFKNIIKEMIKNCKSYFQEPHPKVQTTWKNGM